MKPLSLPPTIRTAKPDELPHDIETLQRITERESANIVQGFTFRYNESSELPFKFFAEINIDNENLWSLFKTLLLQLPDEICLVYCKKDEDPSFSLYMDKFHLLNQLTPYEIELTQDGLLEAGVLYHDESYMEEVFIRAPKYIQYWGMDEERFKNTMTEFGLSENPLLNFIDEYPLATEALRYFRSGIKETWEVLNALAGLTQQYD